MTKMITLIFPIDFCELNFLIWRCRVAYVLGCNTLDYIMIMSLEVRKFELLISFIYLDRPTR